MLGDIQRWTYSRQSLAAIFSKLAVHEVQSLRTSTLVAPFANGP